MKKLTICSILVMYSSLYGQGTSIGSAYLKLPYIAKSASMGEALTAKATGLTGLMINPATLSISSNAEILIGHTEWIQDVRTEFLSAGIVTRFGTFAIALANTNIGNIELRDQPGPASGTFSSHSTLLQLSFARPFNNALSIGLSGKIFYEKIYVDEASGLAMDLGMTYKLPVEGLQLGAAITNIGSNEALRSSTADLPTMLRLGLNYGFMQDQFSYQISADYRDGIQDTRQHVQVGAEATYDNQFSIRFGYLTGYESRNVTAGFGLKYDVINLEYAFVPFGNDLGSAHIISLSFSI
jgi:hypothetical protein